MRPSTSGPRPSARAGRCVPRERWRRSAWTRRCARTRACACSRTTRRSCRRAALCGRGGGRRPCRAQTASSFGREGGGWAPDPFCDEQNLLLRAEGKAVLVTGCAHRGIVNIVRRAQELAGGRIDAVVGGFHLSNPRTGCLRAGGDAAGGSSAASANWRARAFYTGTARATRPLRGCRRPFPDASRPCTLVCAWSCRAQKKRAPAANAGARLRTLTLRASSSP